MNYLNTFQVIRSEGFSEETALVATMMICLNCTKTVKNKHMSGKAQYKDELEETFKTAFWEHHQEIVNEALKIWNVFYDYQTMKALEGLDGCFPKTIRELISEYNQK